MFFLYIKDAPGWHGKWKGKSGSGDGQGAASGVDTSGGDGRGQLFYIMDKRDGTILMQNGYERDTPLMLTEKSGEYDVNGRMYTVLSDDAQYSNLRIVVGIQRSLFQNSIQNVTAIIQVLYQGGDFAVPCRMYLAGCVQNNEN